VVGVRSDSVELGLLARLVDLEPLAEDVFLGRPLPELAPSPRMYGGTILAMATRAAQLTVGPEQQPHALHSFFLNGADSTHPVQIMVRRINDGRSFAARQIDVEQNGRRMCSVLLSLTSTLTTAGSGLAVEMPMRPGVPAPDSGFARNPVMEGAASTRPFDFLEFDVRPFATGSPHDSTRMIWARLAEPVADPAVLSCIVAYMSDFGATIAARALVGATVATPGRYASLNHSLWWHRPIAAGRWLLVDFRPIQAGSSRGLVTGTIHDQDGTHVATIAQEALMQLADPAHPATGPTGCPHQEVLDDHARHHRAAPGQKRRGAP
jgi:acyl-CoA thioesterase-2